LGIEHRTSAPEWMPRNALNNILIVRILASRFFKTRDLGQNLSPNAQKAGDLLENTLAGSGRGAQELNMFNQYAHRAPSKNPSRARNHAPAPHPLNTDP
jgi:hypothetical protein